ncbi:copper amine oxidase N-terminal domain-containing protein [Paenibacillus wulumuqiensis]|uniref:copper amine oxidase N-terminal domain-containing protein n=1 Tax=Paenibacillus wulumuqiensis TaxID=1567107 RepID=UPI000619D74C|nr:copper amine oxidase N-terminal domain-containing protein [Paenibacillus wulumuqiensis]
MNKKHIPTVVLGSILAGSLIVAPLGDSVYAADTSIQIKGVYGIIPSDVAPYIRNGVTMVPINVVSKLGSDNTYVSWNNTSKTVTINAAGTKTLLQLDQKYALQNGVRIELAQPATLKEGVVMVPLRFVGESIGAKVNWDAANRIVYIGEASSSKNEPSPTSTASAIQTLSKQREKTVYDLPRTTLATELPTVGMQTVTHYFPVGQSDVFFEAMPDRISYYEVKNNKATEIWSANYNDKPSANGKDLPFLPYQITKEIGKRPSITATVAYYQYSASISDLRYGLIDIKGNDTELGHTDPAQTKERFPVDQKELALVK